MATIETIKEQVQEIFEGRSIIILKGKDQKHKDITKDEFSDTKLRNFFKKLGLEYEVDNLQNLVKENLKKKDLVEKDLARTSHYVVGDYYSDNMQKTPIQDYNFDIPSTTYIKNIKHKALLAKASKEKKSR